MVNQPDKNIPFEPTSKTKKTNKPKRSLPSPKSNKTETSKSTAAKPSSKASLKSEQARLGNWIPPDVNKRMVKRAAIFCGIPTAMGFTTFIVSYVIVVKHWAELPNSAVVLVSMLFMGVGVLGLSYGVLSASWDENREGNWWGWQDFKQNFGYVKAAWKQQRAEKLSTPKSD